MLVQFFGILSGLLPALGALPYLKDTHAAKTKPHRASFLIWTMLGVIAVITQFAQGASWSLILPIEEAIGPLVIFIMTLRQGEGGFNLRDKLAIALAVFGLILWYCTKDPLTALCITTAVDAIGIVLTVHKTYLDPHSETFTAWFFTSISGLLSCFAVSKVSFGLLLYPIYLFLGNGAVAAVILLKGKARIELWPR